MRNQHRYVDLSDLNARYDQMAIQGLGSGCPCQAPVGSDSVNGETGNGGRVLLLGTVAVAVLLGGFFYLEMRDSA